MRWNVRFDYIVTFLSDLQASVLMIKALMMDDFVGKSLFILLKYVLRILEIE